MKEESLIRERGLAGGAHLAREIADTIIARWGESHKSSDKPFLLLLGGLQGSGKTSTIAELRKEADLDFVIVSPDEIRWEMFARDVFLTGETHEEWAQTVHLTRNMLLKEALQRNFSVVIDQMLTPERVQAVEEIAQEFPLYAHKIKKVYLQADPHVLRERVSNRASVLGRYRGTLPELNASLEKYDTLDTSQFDWVINTGRTSISDVAKEVTNLLK